MSNSQKTALITGGAQRIGQALVNHFHDLGWRVIIHYHTSRDAADQLTQRLNSKRQDSARAFSADLGTIDQIEALAKAVTDLEWPLDLVIHNAPFDVGFLDAELARVGYQAKIKDICCIVDSLVLAKQQFPGQKNNLDALCKRFGISNEHRTLHGALLDADLLAKVYLQMSVNQSDLLGQERSSDVDALVSQGANEKWDEPIAIIQASEEECQAHEAFMQSLA